MDPVVGVERENVFAVRVSNGGVARGGSAFVGGKDHPDRRPLVCLKFFPRLPVIRAIVDYNDLDIAVCLAKHGVYRLVNEGAVVEAGDYDGDPGHMITVLASSTPCYSECLLGGTLS